MKTAKKAVLLVLCAILLVVASVMGTLAYLADDDAVTNTFTVGNVTITLDETDVDVYGKQDGDTRVKENAYKLIPGHTYVKDPKITVAQGSEACWLFVKVENGIAAYEDESNKIHDQLLANNWTLVEDETNVYWHAVVDARTAAQEPVATFNSFKIDEKANHVDDPAWSSVTAANTKVIVTAYAVQYDGFDNTENTDAENAKLAWAAAEAEYTAAHP